MRERRSYRALRGAVAATASLFRGPCVGLRASILTPCSRLCCKPSTSIMQNRKAKMSKRKQFIWVFTGVFTLVSRGSFMHVCVCVLQLETSLLSAPPDKGTVQKVIVLPSNQSMQEDLILEELEVFKVSSLFFSAFFRYAPLLLSRKNQRRGETGGGVRRWATTQRQTDRNRVAVRRWMSCRATQRGMMGNILTHSLFYLLK